MSDSEPATAVAPAAVTLDRVMLAMDVVDTLRHQQALVEAELDDDRRQRDFVERVQAIYASQGIEVSEAVIEEGVRALREDRFVYTPPRRTMAVRFAEIYVERGKWALRAVVVLLLGVLTWAAFAVPAHFRERGLLDAFDQRVVQLGSSARLLAAQAEELSLQVERAQNEDDSAATFRLLDSAAVSLRAATANAASINVDLEALPEPEVYIEDRGKWDERLVAVDGRLSSANAALGAARGLLAAVEQLRTLQVRLAATRVRLRDTALSVSETATIEAAVGEVEAAIAAGDGQAGELALRALGGRIDGVLAARQREAQTRALFAGLSGALAGVDVEPDANRELQAANVAIERSMAAGDWQRAAQQVARLGDLVRLLDQSYELRIVSRPNDRSGVWRHPDGNRRKRNFYIVVEAIGADGRPLALSIESEEDQSTRKVRRFGIRVPESVYEQVKADKLDNGLIDNVVFGSKRRGAREPEYRFPVAGGRITRW